jgi:hypothetical protein
MVVTVIVARAITHVDVTSTFLIHYLQLRVRSRKCASYQKET